MVMFRPAVHVPLFSDQAMSGDSGSVASMTDSPSDFDDCVERWLLGDDESFEQVFHQHYRLVLAFFTRRGFTPQESEDLTQEAFFRVYRSRDSFRGDSQFTTWLFQICTNLFRNNVRDRSAQKRDAQEVSLDSAIQSGENGTAEGTFAAKDEGPLEQALREEAKEKLREALSALPPQMRRCVELRVNEDLKYREIAERMGISIETVKAHLFQARQILKGKLGDYFGDDFDF
jgi:RNA polymerase sigma-70 factor (ECF subfamily)